MDRLMERTNERMFGILVESDEKMELKEDLINVFIG